MARRCRLSTAAGSRRSQWACPRGGPRKEQAMNSANEFSEPGTDPHALIAQLAHWLLGTTLQCAAGLTIGILAARVLRRRQLHWSWATTALAAALLAPSLPGSPTLTLTVAGLSAAARGRRWHREEID